MRSSLATLPLLLALAGVSGTSVAGQSAPTGRVLRPTLVAGTTEALEGIVRAGADGAEWALPGGAKVFATAGSELRVLGVPQPLRLADKQQVNGYTVVLKAGLVRLAVPAGSTSALVVSAPRKTSVIVSSGESIVSAAKGVTVANASGATQVAFSGQRFHPLEPGKLQDDTGARARALPQPPLEVRGAGVTLSFGDAVPLGVFDWEPVAGVAGYRVELRDATTRAVRARADVTEARVPAGFASLAPGAYALSVVSLDATGVESARAPERALRVMRVALPTGGYVDADGAIHLPKGARLALGDTSGVEMTYGSANHFVATPASLELFRQEPRTVRFRVAGTQQDAKLVLIPREARAHVEFGSQAERWPEKPLEIRIRMEGARGDASVSEIVPRPRVTVGVEPVNVAFSRDGDGWRGLLLPRAGRGPWVVRVEVEDQHGIALGRNFIEIAAPEMQHRASDRGS